MPSGLPRRNRDQDSFCISPIAARQRVLRGQSDRNTHPVIEWAVDIESPSGPTASNGRGPTTQVIESLVGATASITAPRHR